MVRISPKQKNRIIVPARTESDQSALREFLRQFFGLGIKGELIELLFFFLNVFAYGYLVFIALDFFFQKSLPTIFDEIADALSEPYLGALSIYFVVRGILQKHTEQNKLTVKEFFFIAWAVLFVVTSFLVYFSQAFHFDMVYNLILKNSLAAFILRLGLFLRL